MGYQLREIFGDKTHAFQRYQRMMYWMPKWRYANPYYVPWELPTDRLELAKLVLNRMSVDLQNALTIFQVMMSYLRVFVWINLGRKWTLKWWWWCIKRKMFFDDNNNNNNNNNNEFNARFVFKWRHRGRPFPSTIVYFVNIFESMKWFLKMWQHKLQPHSQYDSPYGVRWVVQCQTQDNNRWVQHDTHYMVYWGYINHLISFFDLIFNFFDFYLKMRKSEIIAYENWFEWSLEWGPSCSWIQIDFDPSPSQLKGLGVPGISQWNLLYLVLFIEY